MENPAELFEAISHPTRIKILRLLENEPSTFASLKRQLGISSSGNLDHHIKKLGELIEMQRDGLYGLTDTGKEALASVGAVESWKDTERRKLKKFPRLPREVAYLFVLEAMLTGLSVFVVKGIKFSDGSWPLFPGILGFVAFTGFFSVFGILRGRSWGWGLVVIQAITVLVYMMLPFNYTVSHILTATGLYAAEEISMFIQRGVTFVVFGVAEALVLFVALKGKVKEFFDIQTAPPTQRRVRVAGKLIMLVGLIGVFGGSIYFHGPWDSHPLAVTGFFTGLVVILGGVAILMQKFTLGGLITISFCFSPISAFSIYPLFFSSNRFFDTSVVLGTPMFVIAVVAVLLIRSNLQTAFIGFISQIWKSFGQVWSSLMG